MMVRAYYVSQAVFNCTVEYSPLWCMIPLSVFHLPGCSCVLCMHLQALMHSWKRSCAPPSPSHPERHLFPAMHYLLTLKIVCWRKLNLIAGVSACCRQMEKCPARYYHTCWLALQSGSVAGLRWFHGSIVGLLATAHKTSFNFELFSKVGLCSEPNMRHSRALRGERVRLPTKVPVQRSHTRWSSAWQRCKAASAWSLHSSHFLCHPDPITWHLLGARLPLRPHSVNVQFKGTVCTYTLFYPSRWL